jgi:hypothetical protein
MRRVCPIGNSRNQQVSAHIQPTPPRRQELRNLSKCVVNSKRANPLDSTCVQTRTAHEVIPIKIWKSAADGLNLGIARTRHELVVNFATQAAYLTCFKVRRSP